MPLTIRQRVKTNIIPGLIKINPKQGKFRGSAILPLDGHRRGRSPAHIGDEDPGDGEEVHGAAPEAHDDEGGGDGAHEAPDLVADVVLGLELRVREPHEAQDVAEVVRDDDVARQLRHDAHEGPDEQAPPVPRRAEHVEPRLPRVLELRRDGRLDLGELGFRELRVLVAFGVVLNDRLEGFFVSVFADQVSGAFGDEAGKKGGWVD